MRSFEFGRWMVSVHARAVISLLAIVAILTGSGVVHAQSLGVGDEPKVTVNYTYVGKRYPEPLPLSLLDMPVPDDGVQGARVALKENNMTGRLIGQTHTLSEVIVDDGDDVVAAARTVLAKGARFIIADLERDDLLAVAALPEAADALIFNVRIGDDDLRSATCRRNIYHLTPSYAMRADALAQYLVWKKWRNWYLVSGQGPKDLQYADAVRRAAKRFGGKIIEEKSYAYDAGQRRVDSGHQQIQTQMPLLTQTARDYDVLFVADAEESFGEYLMYRTFDPKPVVGTHGLMAVGWHRSFEQYAGTQMQNRFERQAKRIMTERDYYAWLAVRTFGEAVLRTGSADAAVVRDYLLSDKFGVAGFKGQGLTFRKWNQQLRQPVLISGPRALVSISPQDGFLHQFFLTDTLGYDRPESACRLND